MRWLILGFLFFILLPAVLSYVRANRSKKLRRETPPSDTMVLDPQCQSYFPRSEGVVRKGIPFCSAQCADQYFLMHEA
jgi:hypothetical protein